MPRGTPELWKKLLAPANAPLVAAAAIADPGDVRSVAALRKLGSAEMVSLALDLAAGRRRLADKWPGRAERMVADASGAEMASSKLAADQKAARVAAAAGPGASVLDLCCGIGGDAMAMRDAGLEVAAVDMDPVRAWMCGFNAGCRAEATDALLVDVPPNALVHIDPSRRDEGPGGGRRVWRLDDLHPGIDGCVRLVTSAAGGAVKLGPGVDRAAVTARLPAEVPWEMEWLSECGRLTQAVLWTGSLAHKPGEHTATLLTVTRSWSVSGHSVAPPRGALAKWIVEADDALERAGLLGVLCGRHGLAEFEPGLGLLTGDAPADDPMCTAFEVQARMTWNPARVRAWLRAHDGGIVEVKTRAGAVETDRAQAVLRGSGSVVFTLFALRTPKGLEALITRRKVG